MQAPFPDEPTTDTDDGDAAHWLGATMIDRVRRGNPMDYGAYIEAPNGVQIDEDMQRFVKLYVDDVATTMRAENAFTAMVEERVDLPTVHPLAFGTLDCRLYVERTHTLYVWDFKYGRRAVEAEGNDQAVLYVEGLIEKLGLNDQTLTVVVRIAQPRARHLDGPIREWRLTGSDVRGRINQLRARAHEALSPGAKCMAGPWCRDCRAFLACPAAEQMTLQAAALAHTPSPMPQTPEQLAVEKRHMDGAFEAIKARKTAVDSAIEETLKGGGRVPGWALTSSVGKMQWTNPPAATLQAAKALGYDLAVPMTPAQARDKAHLPKEVLDQLAKRKTGTSLVPSDKTLAARAFAK